MKQTKPIRWLIAAAEDLQQIVEGIAQESPRAAQKLFDRIRRKLEILGDFPYPGPVCPHYLKVRMLIHRNYVIYYTVHRREIVIRAVVHGARLFRSRWIRRD